MTYLPFSGFSDISRLCSSSVNIFQLVAISKKISNMFTEKNLYISGQANSYPCHSRVNYINKPTIFFYFHYYHPLFYLSIRKIVV